MPVFCQPTEWRWQMLLKKHKNQVPKLTITVICDNRIFFDYLAHVPPHIDIPFASTESFARLDDRLDVMEAKVRNGLRAQGFVDSQIKTEPFLHLRYEGTDCALMCTPSNQNSTSTTTTRHGDFLITFLER